MRRDPRKQPWQTFPFWFLILSGLAMTVAWKLDLLRPEANDVATTEEVVEEEISPDWASEEVEGGEEAAMFEEEPVVEEDSEDTPRSFPEGDEVIAENSADDTEVSENDVSENMDSEETEPVLAEDTASANEDASGGESDPGQEDIPTGIRLMPAKSLRQGEPSTENAAPTTASNIAAADAPTPSSRSPFGSSRIEITGVRTKTRPAEPAETATWAREPSKSEDTPHAQITAASAVDGEAEPTDQIVQTAAEESNNGSSQVQRLGGETAESEKSSAPMVKDSAASEPFDFAEIDQLIANGEDVEANFQLSTLYWKRPDLRAGLKERLRSVSYRIYFAPEPHYMDGYKVHNGDALEKIAKNYDISWEYLAKLNRTDPKKIRPGQTLKVIRGPFAAVIDLSDMELTVHAHGHYVHTFPIGLGQDAASPIGSFKVREKQRNPTYYGPNGIVENDDPQNPLGEYLVDIGDGFCIHGTIDDSLVGQRDGAGCIRLKKRDIADVFDLLTVGSEIKIRR